MSGAIRITDTGQLPVVIDQLRHLLQMRQMDVAEAAGFRQSQVSSWLSGRTSMDTSSVIRVAAALGYDLALIPREEAEPQPCAEETHSWQHFTAEQADSYWIRCTLQGPHDEHKDANTGLTWTSAEAIA